MASNSSYDIQAEADRILADAQRYPAMSTWGQLRLLADLEDFDDDDDDDGGSLVCAS